MAETAVAKKRAKKRDPQATKERILAAAVKHFGRYGYWGTSLRNILADADASLASVNYHFGSKLNLLVSALDHYFGQTYDRRIELVEEAKKKPIPEPRLRALIEAYIRPHIEIAVGRGDEDHARLVFRVVMEDNPALQKEIVRNISPIRQRLKEELCVCCPDVDETLIVKGIGFLSVALGMAPFELHPEELALDRIRTDPVDVVVEEATKFAYAGFLNLIGLDDK